MATVITIATVLGEGGASVMTAYGTAFPGLGDISNPDTLKIVLGAYALNFGALAWATSENIKAVDDPDVRICANMFTLFSKLLAKKAFPGRPRLQNGMAYGASMILPGAIEAGGLALLLLGGDRGAGGTAARNFAGGAFQIINALGTEAYIRLVHYMKDRNLTWEKFLEQFQKQTSLRGRVSMFAREKN